MMRRVKKFMAVQVPTQCTGSGTPVPDRAIVDWCQMWIVDVNMLAFGRIVTRIQMQKFCRD
jgi:hypothetical protein